MWSGRRASGLGLIDAVGGLNRALQLAKQAAGLALDERVRLLEVSRAKVGGRVERGGWVGRVWGFGQSQCMPTLIAFHRPSVPEPRCCPPPLIYLQSSPLALLSGGGASLPAMGMLLLQSLAGGSAAQGAAATHVAAGAPLLLQALAVVAGGAASSSVPSGTGGLAAGQVLAQMPDMAVEGVASQALLTAGSAPVGGSGSGGLFGDE